MDESGSSSAPPRGGRVEVADATSVLVAATVLASGGVVCVPTESAYGLAADVRHPAACSRIAALKERSEDSPFALIAGDLDQARALAASWPTSATDLAVRHWPGPLTLVVAARPGLPAEIVAPAGGVGVRVSSNDWARRLAVALGGPFTATSANRRGQPPAETLEAARAAFGDAIDLYIDGGALAGGPPSTVAGVAPDGTITVFRAGAIGLAPRSG